MNHWYIQREGGESARGQTSQAANQPGGEQAKGRTSQGVNRQRSEKAIILTCV